LAKLVQCVPNFSEGRRADVVKTIVDAIEAASAVRVIDYSMDTDHNRSVVTFLGTPEDVRKSAFAGAKAAVELIDLNKHKGGHPRLGAVDVIPLVPIHEVTMTDAIALSYDLGKDIADGLRVPVYFYERSAVMRHRTNLAVVRKGGFEALQKSGLSDGREPDLGPSEIHPTAGAVVIGARGPLIAFNVNLATNDMHAARAIADKIRKLRDRGEGMHGVKAIAVHLKSRDIAQVSTNITLPHQVSIYDVYAFVEREAKALGLEVLESELIGAIREESLIEAARSSMKLRGLTEKRVLDHWMK
jgi:glutamate formiminotransferase